jgi:vacuolar protein sorting-associated protein 13A/C
MTKFTGAIGKGLSAATLDAEYQSKRRMTQRRNKPKHALYGVAAGASAFADSVTSAFEGVAQMPLNGAEQGGAAGFAKGVGKGFVGLFTKPAVGVMDFLSASTEGIRNTTTVFDQNDLDRVRLPRFISADGVLRVSWTIDSATAADLAAIQSKGGFGSIVAQGGECWTIL